MYCNSCQGIIGKDDLTYCEQCHAPLHKSCANHCLECGKTLCDTCFAENNFKCEECNAPDEMFKVIRRSHIEQYVGCPYSIYLQLVLGIEPPMGRHAQLGVIVHEIIDKMSEHDISLEEAKNEMYEKVLEWNINNDGEYSLIDNELIQTGEICLENFFLIKDEFPKEFLSEYNIRYSIDNNLPTISCTLDRITNINGRLDIHDWKTGKPMAGKKLVTDLQPPLYIYGVYKEFGKWVDSFTLHYLKTNKHITYKHTGNGQYIVQTKKNTYTLNVEEKVEEVKKILEDIKHKKFNMPNENTSSWRCKNMCWFGTSGKCQGVQAEQWKQLKNKYEGE